MWISLLHYVCNQHEWLGGKCSHGEIPLDERELLWFERRDKDFLKHSKLSFLNQLSLKALSIIQDSDIMY